MKATTKATKTNTKTTSNTTKKVTTSNTTSYPTIATGVRVVGPGKYNVRRTIKGKTIYKTFTNKAKAIAFYKSLVK